MKKKNVVKKSSDFSRIIKEKSGLNNDLFIINSESNNDNITRFGITFVRNIGNAVTRNRLKRQIKAIIDNNKNCYQNNKNYIIIIRKGALDKKYIEMEKSLTSLFIKEKEKK